MAGFLAEELAGTSKENRIYRLGECNLVWKCGIKGTPSRWELHIAIEKKLEEVSLDNLSLNQVMGVDVGENNAAALSTGRIFKAGKMKDDRDKYLSSRLVSSAMAPEAPDRHFERLPAERNDMWNKSTTKSASPLLKMRQNAIFA